MADAEQKEVSSSASEEEVVSNITEQKEIPREAMLNQYNLEQLLRLIKYNQPQMNVVHAQKYIPREKAVYYPNMEQFRRMNVHNQILEKQPMRVANEELAQFYVEPLQQFYQLNTYPFAAWYYPVQMQDIPLLPFFPIFGPIASENVEKTVMPVW
uniref:alpha-S1-casein n=1 Tax=Ictidomys tridecemlineatus TaxID=43179 RepID=UPI001A9E2A64|nr:alpha-S1-casein [Ictidomys tridecemlineatus]